MSSRPVSITDPGAIRSFIDRARAAQAAVDKLTKPKPKPKCVRHGYRWAIDWIAQNDDSDEMDRSEVEAYISVLLVADMFGKSTDDVARDVLMRRLELEELDR